jgi:TetR/AcrR family transcriptional regulator, regulator of cefoperazone and chloramphenicol sensitivity
MRKQRIDGQETRRSLLAAASEIFAKKGFRDATIAEICRQAKANVAAANYHFGGKESLYVESWRFAFEKSLKTYPPNGGVAEGASIEKQLRGRIMAIMRRVIDPQSYELDIFYNEMANPTGLLAGAVQQSIEPIFRGFAGIIRELLGNQPDEKQVRLCLMSIRAQCFGPLMRERRRKIASPDPLPASSEWNLDDLETLVDHVTRFSLAGIREIRSWMENGTGVKQHA